MRIRPPLDDADVQQIAACERWDALPAGQQFRRQQHRCTLLGIPVVFAGDPPPPTVGRRARYQFGRARGKFLQWLET